MVQVADVAYMARGKRLANQGSDGPSLGYTGSTRPISSIVFPLPHVGHINDLYQKINID